LPINIWGKKEAKKITKWCNAKIKCVKANDKKTCILINYMHFLIV